MRARPGSQAVRRSRGSGKSQSCVDAIGRDALSPTDCPPDRLSARLWLNLRDSTLACAAVFRRIAGMPDYEAYLGHLRQHHPDCPVPSEREFFALYMESRYGNGPSRCC